MTLDETIKRTEELAELNEDQARVYKEQGDTMGYLSYEECAKEHRQLAEWLKELKQLREQTKWIPCTERLPEDGDTYLVTIEYKSEVIGVDVASYSPVDGYIDKHWETFNDWKEDDDTCYHVTACMPLPEPYMAESRNVLAEIKAEIEQKCCITVGSENEPAMTLYDVFQIIDKYRTGSEEIKDE